MKKDTFDMRATFDSANLTKKSKKSEYDSMNKSHTVITQEERDLLTAH